MRNRTHMAQSFSARLLLAAVLVGSGVAPAVADVPSTYQTGQSIEVREGDSWSSASVVRREGRKYLIHYAGSDASTDEWVGTDRMRLPGTAGTPTAPAGEQTTPTNVPPSPSAPVSHHAKSNEMFPEPDEVIGVTEANRSAVEEAQPAEAPAAWSVAPDPVTKPLPVESWHLKTHATDDKMSVKQLLPCAGGGAILGFADFFDKTRQVERVGTIAPAARASLPQQSLPLAASPSGTLLVCQCSAFGFGNNARIDAYTLPAGSAAAIPLVSFKPYPDENGNGKGEDVRFAAALSDTRIITCDLKGRLIAWDIAANSVTGIWRVDLGQMHFGGFGVNVVVSPGGKWLAAAGKEAVTFIDTAKGQVLGSVAIPENETVFDLSCSPTGRMLIARASDDSLVSFDTTTGKQLRTVALPPNALGRLCCPDDGFALIEGRTLIGTNTGAVVPQYQPAENSTLVASGPGVTLMASDTKLSAAHLPGSAIRSAVEAAGDSVLVLKPGMSVKLDIQLDMSDKDKADVESAIRSKLTQDGFVIADDADTTIMCRTEPGAQHEHVYGKSIGPMHMPVFAAPGGGTSMILTDKITRLTIEQNGLTVWERKRTVGPANSFVLKDGQSLEDGAKATIQYDARFLINLAIPPYIARQQSESPVMPNGQRPHFRPGDKPV